MPNTHSAVPDPRNASVLVYVNGAFVPRADAKVSVFDAGFLVGDGIWEGLRLHHGAFPFLERHLDRLERDDPPQPAVPAGDRSPSGSP